MRPDVVIANHDAGPEETLNKLRLLGIEVVQIKTGPTIDDALAGIRELGDHVQEPIAAEQLLADIQTALNAVPTDLESKPRVLFALGTDGNLPMVAGTQTRAATMIEAAGGENIANYRGYRPMSAEAVLAAAPQVILVASHALPGFGGEQGIRRHNAFRQTPAVANDAIIVMDSQLLLSMGPRLGEAVRLLAEGFATASATQATRTAAHQP